MFSISLDLAEVELTGLDALDFRRRLKLPDGSMVETHDATFVSVEVSESFVRANFDRTSVHVRRLIPVAILAPGDLEPGPDKHGSDAVSFVEEMPPERVIELWTLAGAYNTAHKG